MACMVHESISMNGWKSRKLAKISMYQCPECGNCQDMLFLAGKDGKYPCFGCNKKFARNEYHQVKRTRTVVVCGKCNREVALAPSTVGLAGVGYICSDCSNYVAVFYGTHFVNPRTVLTFRWNPTVCRRAERTQSGLSFLVCDTMKDLLVLTVLQAIVKQEDSRFLYGNSKEYEAGLLLDCRRRKYLGFLVWTERVWVDGVWKDSDHAVLRQMFVVEDERRKGFAQQMVTHWVKQHADKLNPKFGIEAPNENAIALHLKLGHIKAESDSYHGLKCFLVPSF
jgi:hypothetical protein